MKTMTTTSNATGTKVMNKQGILGKMKVLVLALLATMTLGFASCSSDDDSNGPAQPTAAKVENVNLKLKITEAQDLAEIVQYTVQWYDAKGELQEKTLTPEDPKIDLNINYEPTATKFGYKITTKTARKYEENRLYDTTSSFAIDLSAQINGSSTQIKEALMSIDYAYGEQKFSRQSSFSDFCLGRTISFTRFYQLTNAGLERMN